MWHAQDIRKQLVGIMDRHRHDVLSAGKDYNCVQKAICSGFFQNSAKKDSQEGYKTLVEGTPFQYISIPLPLSSTTRL
ncbi:hypothetical protein BD769DRAFT_1465807, partial [Suillus cothurnatus]